jgi:hypothetical protein
MGSDQNEGIFRSHNSDTYALTDKLYVSDTYALTNELYVTNCRVGGGGWGVGNCHSNA